MAINLSSAIEHESQYRCGFQVVQHSGCLSKEIFTFIEKLSIAKIPFPSNFSCWCFAATNTPPMILCLPILEIVGEPFNHPIVSSFEPTINLPQQSIYQYSMVNIRHYSCLNEIRFAVLHE